MHRLTHRRVVHVQVVANGPYHHLARIQPNADAQRRPVLAPHVFSIGLHGGLHGQRRIAGAQGVVLMRNRGAKQGHNAVAQHLVHRAFEAVHGVHHDVDSGINELLGGLGVEVFDQFGGIFDVGKQHRHLLAFAFQGARGTSGSSRPDASGCRLWRG